MDESRPALFRGRHFREEIIVLCLRWYLRYPLSYRNLEEMMAERGLSVDHSTIARRVLHYSPILNERIRRQMRCCDCPAAACPRDWRKGSVAKMGNSRR
jgi:transposase, IS6 family